MNVRRTPETLKDIERIVALWNDCMAHYETADA